jgi:hypothetical protein
MHRVKQLSEKPKHGQNPCLTRTSLKYYLDCAVYGLFRYVF